MKSPMDRGFGDDPFRRMERKKALRSAGLPDFYEDTSDIEDPIIMKAYR